MGAVDAITELMAERGHEQVVFVGDHASGLRAVIAIHSTALGPSLGGIRFWRYASEREAVVDALRLSEAMTLKASIAGLHQGGGKAVVIVDDPERPRSELLLRALGQAIHELGGRYLAAEDVGATQRDMDVIADVTPWVTGIDVARGGSGDPSPATAYGALCAMRAVVQELDGPGATLAGRRVVVQGAGHVGTHLVAHLAAVGARVTVTDVVAPKADALVRAFGVEVVEPDRAIDEECDVFAPCALGAVIDAATVTRLRCRAVCGAANNQLADDSIDEVLSARGVLYAPDFVVNAGGIINVAGEFTGYSRERAFEATARIESTLSGVFARARRDGIAPGRAVADQARERLVREGGGRRWRPGDAAAWTAGAPLTTLRPSESRTG
jgi:leucine dehydrogenase